MRQAEVHRDCTETLVPCCNMFDDYKYMDVNDTQGGNLGSLEYRYKHLIHFSKEPVDCSTHLQYITCDFG